MSLSQSISKFYFFFFFFWPCFMACGILVPWSGIEPMLSAMRVQNLNYWIAREFSLNSILFHWTIHSFLCLCQRAVFIGTKHFNICTVSLLSIYGLCFFNTSVNVMQETPVRLLGQEDLEKGIGYLLQYSWDSLVAHLVKNPPTMQETWVWSLVWEDTLRKGKATHSSILAWRIPWTV